MRRAGAMLAIAFGCAALVAAQPPQPPQPPTEQTPPAASQTTTRGMPAGAITVTGCLQRGEASSAPSPTGTTGTPPSRAGSGGASFILTNASSSASGSAGPGGAAGASPKSGTSYALDGSHSDLTAENVGKKVEVTGTIEPSGAGAAASTPGSSRPAQKLKVSSAKVVGGDCSAEK